MIDNLQQFMDSIRNSLSLHPALSKFLFVLALFLVVRFAYRAVARAMHRVYWRRLSRDGVDSRDQRDLTILTLLENLIRYIAYGAFCVVALSVAIGGIPRAVFGASIIVLIVGFSVQRLLGDMVSGALLLFERHYAVGDYIELKSQNVSGFVEHFSLRTTVVRNAAGDRLTVLNGQIGSVHRHAISGRQIQLQALLTFVSDADGDGNEQPSMDYEKEVHDALEPVWSFHAQLNPTLWLAPPTVNALELSGPQATAGVLRVSGVALPGQGDAASTALKEQLDEVLAQWLIGDVVDTSFDSESFGLLGLRASPVKTH